MSQPAPSSGRVTLREVLAAELAKDGRIVGGKVAGKVYDLHTPIALDPSQKVEPVRASDPEGLRIVRHSTAHVMADAVQRLFPGTKVTFGPATDSGFYYDFDKPSGPFTDEDLAKIEDKMREIVAAKRPFRREVVSRADAQQLFESMGETYKREHIDNLPADEEISLYKHSDGNQDWVDLCEGPHVPHTGLLGAVKLLSVAGAYWRGDERNPMLQRIHGTAFSTEKELGAHLKLIAEAKERDHRKLGKELELFMFHEYAPAMPFFLPRGAFVYNKLVQYLRDLYLEYGYTEVVTPQIFDTKLFLTSGHMPHYRENMFLALSGDMLDAEGKPVVDDDGKAVNLERLGQKPMNCPSHCLIFGHRRRSYRELPWRMADFGRLHRYERGGVVHGLARVRSFCQDDGHIFCTEDQIEGEIQSFLKLLYEVYAAFRFEKVDIKLATRPKKRIGTDAQWDVAEKALADALDKATLAYEVLPEEGAFYGPKLEFHIEDALKRAWQLGTIQLDYGFPERFDLTYTGPDGAPHRPVMLHRAIFGSLERFMSLYIEHTGGNFPTWIAPEQAVVVTVSERQDDYAKRIVSELTAKGLRVRADLSSDKLGAKIRVARHTRVPYILVVGDKEAEGELVAPRSRDLNKDLGPTPLADFTAKLLAEAQPPRLHGAGVSAAVESATNP
jgi:threonyl-tRNA synthetase